MAKALFDIELTKELLSTSKIAVPTCHAPHMHVLFSSGRKIHSSLGDENCLFHTFSKELLSNETHHLRIRTLLTDVVKWTGDIPWISDPTAHWQVHNRACAHDAKGIYMGDS